MEAIVLISGIISLIIVVYVCATLSEISKNTNHQKQILMKIYELQQKNSKKEKVEA